MEKEKERRRTREREKIERHRESKRRRGEQRGAEGRIWEERESEQEIPFEILR